MNMGKDTDICMDTPIDIRQTHACGHEHGHWHSHGQGQIQKHGHKAYGSLSISVWLPQTPQCIHHQTRKLIKYIIWEDSSVSLYSVVYSSLGSHGS
jgi:ABC-type Zn2+ transport system substrate-binding protein/surface adhesin